MAELTTYIVLRRDATPVNTTASGTLGWRIENSNVPASNAEAAIRLACRQDDAPAGTYVAVPARSWRPVTVHAVQHTTLKLDPA